MSAIPAIISTIALALLVTGAGAAWWGQRNIDPECAYLGALFIFVAIILAGLVGCGWLLAAILEKGFQ